MRQLSVLHVQQYMIIFTLVGLKMYKKERNMFFKYL